MYDDLLYDELFYKRLIQLRALKDVSARDMSLSIGQSANYINMIENKKNFPSMAGFFYICEYLQIHPKDFFDDSIENPELYHGIQDKLKLLTPEQASHIAAIIDDLTQG